MAAGCVSVNKSVLAPNPTSRTFGEQDVYVYFQDDSIPEHTPVAILILGELEEPGTGARVAAAPLGTSSNRETQAIAIYVPSIDPGR